MDCSKCKNKYICKFLDDIIEIQEKLIIKSNSIIELEMECSYYEEVEING